MRSFRLAAVLAATALAAFIGLTLPGSAAAADGHSAASAAVSPQAVSDCPNTWFCFWQDANYSSTPGKVQGDNADWRRFSHSGCYNGTWSDCASSAWNRTGTTVVVWRDIGYSGLLYCLPNGWYNSNFAYAYWPGTFDGLNDSISSNQVVDGC
ncbi:peptidase inhibitor family I36 protein [Streptomyces sp. NPDC058683]|uniref:peptidase inhibitor family I36 protein n=1 Tax=Streptomyces sp. NPDC058683 TaxID=3346597 RepID=UPI00365943FA